MEGKHQASSNNGDISEPVSVMRLDATNVEGRSANEVEQNPTLAGEGDSIGADNRGARGSAGEDDEEDGDDEISIS